jgi:DNA-directed RNA polymerase subunit RPC12/RpoP
MKLLELLTHRNAVHCEQCGSSIWSHEPKIKDGQNIFCCLECKEEYNEDNAPTVQIVLQELPLEYHNQQLQFRGV